MSTPARRMGRAQWAQLVLLSLFGGSAFFFGKFAVRELSPFAVVFARVTISALGLHAAMWARGKRLPSEPRLWRDLMVLGLLNNALPFSLIFWGQTRIASGLASIINATTPAWVAVLAHCLGRERITRRKAAGVALGILGAVTLIGWDILLGQRGNVMAQLAVIGGSVCYASASIFGQRLNGTPPLVLATGQLTCASLLTLPVALLTWPRGQPLAPSPNVVLAVLTLGLMSTGLSYVVYFHLLASAGASNVMLLTFLAPVSANLLGAAFLGERIGPQQLLGMALIGLGLMVIDGRLLCRRRAVVLNGGCS